MKLVLKSAGFAVFDDWLTPETFLRLGAFLRGYRYFSVTRQGKHGPDGTLSELQGALAAGELRLLGGKFVVRRVVPGVDAGKLVYPSGTPIDAVLESVDQPELQDYLGKPVEDWHRLGAGPRLYPKGGGLDEHDDADSAGTFVLYAHPDWKEDWGGTLEIGGQRVWPMPNRCAFIKGGTPHTVRPVLEAAGERLRMSVIGYTRKPKNTATVPGQQPKPPVLY